MKKTLTTFIAKPFKTGRGGLSRVVLIPRSKFKENILKEDTPYEFAVSEVDEL